MLINSSKIIYIIGSQSIIEDMPKISSFPPFDNPIIDYLSDISKHLLANSNAKSYPDIITFAFWCRRSNLLKLMKSYNDTSDRLGRGIIFHIAPSNVAVNFAYSLVAGLLAGNSNILRLPSKYFPQVDIICEAFKCSLNNFIKPHICLVKYDHSEKVITDHFSKICDSRIVWGGDLTISEIRKSPLKARATEITFADRYSIFVINADSYLDAPDKDQIAQAFYNDTYLTDQNACTSPFIVIWMGANILEAQEIFWGKLYSLVKSKFTIQPSHIIDKTTNSYIFASTHSSIKIKNSHDNLILRVIINNIDHLLPSFKGNCGYFYEYAAKDLSELLPLCSDKCQTLSYYGINKSELYDFIRYTKPRGIDRIVPVGRTMDFSLIWDGYDLIRSLSRIITY